MQSIEWVWTKRIHRSNRLWAHLKSIFVFLFVFHFLPTRFTRSRFRFVNKIKQTSRGNLGEGFGEDYEQWLRTKQQIKPDDQLELTEAELSEDVVRVLDTENSSAAKNLVIFSFKESAFVPVRFWFSFPKSIQIFWFKSFPCFNQLPPPPNIVTLLSVEGTALHIDSEEAQTQIRELGTGMTDDAILLRPIFFVIWNCICIRFSNDFFFLFWTIDFSSHFSILMRRHFAKKKTFFFAIWI